MLLAVIKQTKKMQFLLRWTATVILILLGWAPVSRKDIKFHLMVKKGIIVYNHTTAAELGLAVLYAWSCPELFDIAYFVVKPSLYWYLQHLSSTFVVATSLEERNQGFVAKTSELFAKRDKYHIYIAPDGQRKLGKWLPGYWKLAASLNNQDCDDNTPIYIGVMGFDFVQHRLRFGHRQVIHNSTDFTLLEQRLQKSCSDIVPLYPECCACCRSAQADPSSAGSVQSCASDKDVKGCASDKDVQSCASDGDVKVDQGQHSLKTQQPAQQQAQHPTLLDYVWLTAFWTPLVPLYYAFQFDTLTALIGAVCSILSVIYHYSDETVLVNIEPLLIKVGLIALLARVWVNDLMIPLVQDGYLCALAILTLGCYWLGCGRKSQTTRSYSYIYFHSLFHCLVSLCLIRIFNAAPAF